MKTGAFIGGEYSYHIPLLLSKKRSGYVHSVFNNGFNIVMDDSLVFIGNKKSGLLPFGIHLQEDMAKVVQLVDQREPVSWNEGTASLEFSKLSIRLGKGEGFKNGVASLRSNHDLQTGFERLVSGLSAISEPTGLDINIGDFLKKFDYVGEKECSEAERLIVTLMHVAMSSDADAIESTLRYFLGRGKGLTPSGDDMLIGFLAFDSIVHFVSPSFYQTLSDLLERELLTTDVSREYLRYALNNEFSSSVTDVVNSLSGNNESFHDAFNRLLDVGHSSGLDTLFGILVGMLAFKNPIEQ